jgi:ATP-dependent helicase/nuclease subunit B
MMQFILGKSGTGKTTLINNMITELVEQGERKVIMLIPDQSSFETEKIFLDLLGAKKAKQISVFGFSKLCRFVFEKTGNIPTNVIDNGTRSVLMNLALEQLTEKLTLFKTKNSRSVSEVMLQTLVECKKNSISTDSLRLSADKISDTTLKTKLKETALVLDTFDALLSQSYVDPLDDLTRLYNILLEKNIFQDYILFIDSFSGFTAQQLKVLRLLFNQCSKTYIALTLDPLAKGNEEVFETSYKTMRTITELCNRDFIDIKKPLELTECKRFVSDELKLLESSIFRNDYAQISEIPQDIVLYTANNPYSECEYVARQIKRLVVEEGYLYSDISVITHDTDNYNGIINVIFDKYEIPYFMDAKKDIEVKPVIRFVTSLFRMTINDFDREDVISLLKTALTYNSSEEINIFENYIYVWNINNSAFKKEFKQNPKGFSDDFTDLDYQNLAIAEKVRASVIEPVIEFKKTGKDKTGREITELLYNLMTDMGVQTALNSMYDFLESGEEKGLGAEQIKIWNMLMEVFDKMVAVVGDKPISLKRYFELLTIQISSMQLSEIPQTLDSVTVTSAQRVRLSKQRASFLIGCVDGSFPAVPHTSGVFSSFELKILTLNDISIGDDFSELSSLETFMTYSCMTSPSEKLYLSFPMADMLGNQNTRSAIFDETLKVFTSAVVLDDFDVNSPKESMWAIAPAFEEYARSLSNHSTSLLSLADVFESDKHYAPKNEALKRALDKSPFKIENSQNAHTLFGDNLRISASQIEKFNLCRFSYFCSYGLKLRERRKADMNPMEYGTLVHYILEQFFTKFNKAKYSDMTEQELMSFVDSTLNHYTEMHFGGSESKTKSFLYKLSVLKENVFVLLSHIITELSQSRFDVADCELKIGSDIPAYTLKLPTGESIAIQGCVDRVDIMELDGTKYLRIVDYKTGTKQFKLSDILYGLNLQMLLYLYSIEQNGQDKYGSTTPAGILYMPATAPIISAEKSITDEKIEKELDKALKMNGLLLNDVKVIKGMDASESAQYIPVKIKLDTPTSERSLATLEEFGMIFNKLDIIISNMGKDLYDGNIQAAPAKGAHDACEFCPYDSVCAYHLSQPINTFDVKNKVVFDTIQKELSNGGEL